MLYPSPPADDDPGVTSATAPRRASAARRFDWTGFLLLCAIFVGVAAAWNEPWILPLKLFVVLVHEMSHAVAALLTGGRVGELSVHVNEAGHCVSAGGIPFVVVSAGYLGSMLAGAALLLVAARTRASRLVAAVLGALVAIVALRFVPEASFGRAFAVFAGIALGLLSLCPPVVTEFALRVIGLTSCLYAILDVKHDVLDRDHPHSDAMQLERLTGVPGFVWGVLWIGVSLVVTALAARHAVVRRKDAAARRG